VDARKSSIFAGHQDTGDSPGETAWFDTAGRKLTRVIVLQTQYACIAETGTEGNGTEETETTTINIRVTERQLEEIDQVWKEEGYTSRSEFLRHAIRDATRHPGVSRAMLASIAAEEYAMRKGESEAISREGILDMIDDEE